MIHVFARVGYSILNIPGLFSQLSDFIGHFHIQQTVTQSHDKSFDIWFYTDAVKIEEGKSRQVEIIVTTLGEGKSFSFEIKNT